MKFTIEIVRDDGQVLLRMAVDAISPKRAINTATELLRSYQGRGATTARISTDKGEQLYKL
jgi:hypothetical protein